MRYWPKIGDDLHDVSISCSPDDTLTLEVVSIDVGPHTGFISPELAIYDEESGGFTDMVSLNLGTQAHDDTIGSTTGGTVGNPLNTTINTVTGFGMQFRPSMKESDEWQPGARATETWTVNAVWTGEYPYVNVYQSVSTYVHKYMLFKKC